MNAIGLEHALEACTLSHYSIACVVQHAFGATYRTTLSHGSIAWSIFSEGHWYEMPSAYHSLRVALSSELAPFLHGHIASLFRHSNDFSLIERLQAIERMLLDAPQKDWILKECESVMLWEEPVEIISEAVSFYI